MKRILITGANGYIGANLSKSLAENGYIITAWFYPNVPEELEWRNIIDDIIVGDIRDNALIDKVSNDYYDTIIHLVSLDHFQSNGEPDFVTSVNINPTFNLLSKFSKKNNLNKFIYFSTVQVYGKFQNKIITEETIPHPQNIYGLTHLISEQICSFFNISSSINCISLRLSNSYGSPVFKENNCWWLVINDFCKSAYCNGTIELLSDGSPMRDFIHFSDIFRALEILIDSNYKDLQNNVYQVSSGETLTILEIANTVKKVFEQRYKRNLEIFVPSSSNPSSTNIIRYQINNEKLKALGFSSKTNIKEGIIEIFEYLEKNYEQDK